MIMIYYRVKKLKKRLHVLEVDIISIKKNIDLMSLAQRRYFLQEVFQMTTIVLVSIQKTKNRQAFFGALAQSEMQTASSRNLNSGC